MLKKITASILIIGNEILSGRVQDVNVKFIATRLALNGIDLKEVRIIPDIKDVIIESVNELRKKNNYVFTTGGIGPTHDDITAKSIADAFGVKLIINEIAFKTIEEYYKSKGEKLNSSREKMAYIPENASLIINDITKAPGFRIENVFVLAGIPNIMQGMFKYVEESIEKLDPIVSNIVNVYIGESLIAEDLSQIQEKYSEIDIGIYPIGRLGAGNEDGKPLSEVVFKGRSKQEIHKSIDEFKKKLNEKNIVYEE